MRVVQRETIDSGEWRGTARGLAIHESVFRDGVFVNIVEGQNPINRKLVVKSLQIHVNRKHGPSVAHHFKLQDTCAML